MDRSRSLLDPRRFPWAWIGLLVAVFFVVSFLASTILYLNQREFSYDLGIFQQALSSTNQHYTIPFYEAPDCLQKFRCSFLLVHPALVLYGLAPVYALSPTPFTLFAVQSAGVALAAVPLYALTRDVTGSRGRGLLAAALYLVWIPLFTSEAYSFHLEPFLPLELIGFFFLWRSRRYAAGALVLVIAFLTLEVVPIFTFLMAVFFLLPSLERGVAARRARGPPDGPDAARPRPGWLGTELRRRDVQMALLLGVVSVVAYVVLYAFMNDFGFALVHAPAPTSGFGASLLSNPSSPPISFNFGRYDPSLVVQTAWYWFLLYALFAFIPLFAPRTYVLSFPWIVYTFLTNSARFVTIGHQYVGVIAGPIAIGLAYGFRRVPFGARPAAAAWEATIRERPFLRPSRVDAVALRRRRAAAALWAGLLVVLVAANLALSPLNPHLPDTVAPFGKTFVIYPYNLTILPGYERLVDMLALVPANASVLVPNHLYPLLANHVYAVLYPYPTSSNTTRLPFNITLPAFVVVGRSLGKPPANVYHLILNGTGYGERASDDVTPVGPVSLYEWAYTGPKANF